MKQEMKESGESNMNRAEVLASAVAQFERRNKFIHGFGYAFKQDQVKKYYYFKLKEDQLHNVFSVTKTVTSIALGIALKRCNLTLDVTLGTLFMETLAHSDPQSMIRLEDLLTMRSGYAWDEQSMHHNKDIHTPWFGRDKLVQQALRRSMDSQPGQRFNYDSLNSHILSAVIHALTGLTTQAFADIHIFKPLGIKHAYWECDADGLAFGGHGLYMTLSELLALGVALNDQEQMIQWVGDSYYKGMKTGMVQVPHRPYSYGYHTWIGVLAKKPYFAAFGFNGQRIICIPDEGVLVTFAKIWPEFGPLDAFFEAWLMAEKEGKKDA